jgi:hypothetical protein
MSIVASVKVNDGIVLGADSATTISAQVAPNIIQPVKTYQNAQKIYRVTDLKVAILTYGIGNIGQRSITSLIYEFNNSIVREKFNSENSIEEIANSLLVFIKGKYDEAFSQIEMPHRNQLQLGMFVAGFSDSDIMASEWEFSLPSDTAVKKVREQSSIGLSWRGMIIPFHRIYKGFDPRLIDELIKKYNLNHDEVLNVINKYQTPVAFNGMPLLDAIEFLKFVLLTTINNFKFEVGFQLCSEPIDIVVITRKEFKEVILKELNF